MKSQDLDTAAFTYTLPESSIAKYPVANRDDARLLVWREAHIADKKFAEVHTLVKANSLLVFNNTRVIQARLIFQKPGAKRPIEVFCLEPLNMSVEQAMSTRNAIRYTCLVGNAKRWSHGLVLQLDLPDGDRLNAQMVEKQNDTYTISLAWQSTKTFAEVLEQAGKVPLPPYLHRESEATDRERYQTIYAKHHGSVAAPTAGLHFTPRTLEMLKAKGVALGETTLHVGAGTFKPISTNNVAAHSMHAEEMHVSAEFIQQLLHHKGEIIAVGTTATRTLESIYWLGVKVLVNQADNPLQLSQWDAYQLPEHVSFSQSMQALLSHVGHKSLVARTALMIMPGYRFRVIDGLFTNFHQPGSTLILLVAAVLGDAWREVYSHAVNNGYRFLSYGDSNLYGIPLERKIARL
jgi:S-adenosylmethionine:tRNA ribosyltransferase-isomerase